MSKIFCYRCKHYRYENCYHPFCFEDSIIAPKSVRINNYYHFNNDYDCEYFDPTLGVKVSNLIKSWWNKNYVR
jgi:hypothetical protein